MTKLDQNQQVVAPDMIVKIEEFFTSAGHFIRAFIRTLAAIAWRPTNLDSDQLPEEDRDQYVKPLTFLILSAYPALNAVRLLVGTMILILPLLFTRCTPGSKTEPELPVEKFHQIGLPSVEQLLFLGIPVILGIAVVSRAVRFFLISGGRRVEVKLDDGVCYAAGLSFIFVTAAVLISYTWSKVTSTIDIDADVGDEFLLITVILVFFWPVVSLYSYFANTVPLDALRSHSRMGKKILLSLGAVLTIAGVWASSAVVMAPLIVSDISEFASSYKSLISASEISSGYRDDQKVVDLVVVNNSRKPILVLRDPVIYWKANKKYAAGRTLSNGEPMLFDRLLPNEQVWLQVALSKQSNIDDETLNIFVPRRDEVLEFRAVDADGSRESVFVTAPLEFPEDF